MTVVLELMIAHVLSFQLVRVTFEEMLLILQLLPEDWSKKIKNSNSNYC